jgi:hypothetical protein
MPSHTDVDPRRHAMASKDKGGSKGSKKVASQTLKQKREAKKAKKAGK